MGADSRERPELWVVAAWAIAVAELALAIYLGLKRPGLGPVRAYVYGPWILIGAALLIGALGLTISVWRRPFPRPPRVVAFCVLAFVIATATFQLPFPAHRSDRPSAVTIHLPFRGEWAVAWGGEDEQNILRQRPDRCFGFDFVIERNGSTRASPSDPRSAFAFDQPVLAPCDGTVAAVVDRWPDDGASAPDDLGNHLVLEIAPGEYLFLAGLKQGSIAVEPGERVTRNQELARAGFSAASRLVPEPHLSMHLQDTPLTLEGQGIPFFFSDYNSGERHIERGVPMGVAFSPGRPVTGQRVANVP